MRLSFSLAFLAAISAVGIVSGAADKQPTQLPDAVHVQVERLSKAGDSLAKQAKYREAVEKYVAALDLLPEPKANWEACTWLLAAIGDANFLGRHYEQARRALSDAMHCPGAIGNPFIHLRLGQAQFELGDRQRAADELARAYMGAGKDIFSAEDPKYFEFLETVLKPPANGKPPVAAPRNVEFAGGDGNGCDRAVVIRGSKGSRDIVAGEMAWLRARYPGYKFSDNTVETRGRRTFEEITIETAAGERKVVCFEVTEGFGNLGR